MKKNEISKPEDPYTGFADVFRNLETKVADLNNKLDLITNPSKQDELLTIDQVIKKLHISKRTFFAWKQKGLISCVQVGAKILIRQSAIEKLLDEHHS